MIIIVSSLSWPSPWSRKNNQRTYLSIYLCCILGVRTTTNRKCCTPPQLIPYLLLLDNNSPLPPPPSLFLVMHCCIYNTPPPPSPLPLSSDVCAAQMMYVPFAIRMVPEPSSQLGPSTHHHHIILPGTGTAVLFVIGPICEPSYTLDQVLTRYHAKRMPVRCFCSYCALLAWPWGGRGHL